VCVYYCSTYYKAVLFSLSLSLPVMVCVLMGVEYVEVLGGGNEMIDPQIFLGEAKLTRGERKRVLLVATEVWHTTAAEACLHLSMMNKVVYCGSKGLCCAY